MDIHSVSYKQISEEYEDALRQSEEIAAKESILSSMSHEIRNPLNVIVGFADILVNQRNTLSDDELRMYGGYIEQSKKQIFKLLDHVMKYSCDNCDTIDIKLSKKDVSSLMEETYQIHTVIVPKNLEFCFEKGSDAQVMVNRSALMQVMSNLMNNAIKFTDKGSITLGWQVDSNPEGGTVVMYVEDTGKGIKEEDLTNIFTKYYKTDNHTVGAGIGLPLCKHLVESMNGTISVKSTLGQGSRFEVRLPLK